MASFTVPTNTTDSAAKTVSNDDTGTIQSGGILTGATDITWTGGSASPGVVINNSGSILATTRGIDTSGSFSTGSFTLNNNAGAKLIASGNDAFRINTNITNGTITVDNAGLLVSGAVDANGKVVAHASGQALDFAAITSQMAFINITNEAGATIGASGDDAIRPGAGHIDIENSGLIDATASASRAINLNTTNLSNIVTFTLNNHLGGTVQSQGDAVRISASTLTGNPSGTFTVDNAGTIQSTGVGGNNGQAIDFNDLVSTNGKVTITNEATGLIQAADADAIRAGTNATINNFGTIKSLNGTPTSTGNDAIDFQANTGGTVNNGDATHTAALISGARHGITGDNPVTVNNYGEIIGNSGSGINLDTVKTTTTTVINHGTIIGTSVTGDGVDIDGLISLDNFGSIQATGVHVVEANGSVDIQEAVTIGGGSIINEVGGVITSFERAITVNDSDGTGGPGGVNGDNHGNGFAPTIITNWGLIHGGTYGAISITDTFDDTITNHGKIEGSIVFANGVGTSSGNDTINNYGTIDGTVSLADGNDIVNEYTGSSLTGLLDGGAGTDTVNLLGNGTGTLANVTGVEILHVQGGQWTVTDSESFSSGTTIDQGAALVVGSTGALASDVLDNGVLSFGHSDTVNFANTITGQGFVEQIGTGTLVLSGHNSYGGGTEVASGTLDVVQADSAGTGAITLDAGAQTLKLELTAFTGGHFANVVDGFSSEDSIDLAGNNGATNATLGAGNLLTVSGGSGGTVTIQLDPNQSFAGDVFRLASDTHGGTTVTVEHDLAPVLSSPDSFSIQENHTAVGSVTAADPEQDAFVFAIFGGDDQGFFKIDPHTGLLSFINSPDFETPEDANHDGVYDVVVSATDAFGAASSQDISVKVTDVAETGRTINGTSGNDMLTGTTGDDTINGGNGNDTIDGGDGNDIISGGNGSDMLIGGRGNNVMDGGNDNDTLIAGNGNNTMTGGNGNDVLTAGNGNNVMSGGNGDDVLIAGNGNNVMDGGNGNDVLRVGSGNNILTGGNGNDTFVFPANLGQNVITDFSHGDVIEFDHVFQNFQAVQAAMHQVGTDTVITVASDETVTLSHVTMSSLHASDFLLA
ncbi:beta strand repeat-containing protein [Rhodoplanes sp. Z2-YC6860]|uniref:beta strand repeat-containing protein n=1 Tax=Rhodoplanes sp. Z2-YC6860 TaxID=674703 RepID=UPI00078EAAFF|nr:autotransporter-associated beta strand repeat-containing protein [Rhodoplanes sp. Z2-YC6860]AMN43158.1 outer membrane autotransporter [Rhodoplanes sp. Z2-YC6860]